eukprot:g79812.t1
MAYGGVRPYASTGTRNRLVFKCTTEFEFTECWYFLMTKEHFYPDFSLLLPFYFFGPVLSFRVLFLVRLWASRQSNAVESSFFPALAVAVCCSPLWHSHGQLQIPIDDRPKSAVAMSEQQAEEVAAVQGEEQAMPPLENSLEEDKEEEEDEEDYDDDGGAFFFSDEAGELDGAISTAVSSYVGKGRTHSPNRKRRSRPSAEAEHPKPTCRAQHALRSFTTPNSGWFCSSCEEMQKKDARMYGCRECDYDLCKACYERPAGQGTKEDGTEREDGQNEGAGSGKPMSSQPSEAKGATDATEQKIIQQLPDPDEQYSWKTCTWTRCYYKADGRHLFIKDSEKAPAMRRFSSVTPAGWVEPRGNPTKLASSLSQDLPDGTWHRVHQTRDGRHLFFLTSKHKNNYGDEVYARKVAAQPPPGWVDPRGKPTQINDALTQELPDGIWIRLYLEETDDHSFYNITKNEFAETIVPNGWVDPPGMPTIPNKVISGQELVKAAKDGQFERVQELLAQGASVESKDWDGDTALHNAGWKGHRAVAAALLAAGANVHASGSNGSTALHRASANGQTATAEVLLAAGAVVNATDNNGSTSLHRAGANGQVTMAELLLAAGADLNATNKHGYTALHYAGREGHTAMAEVLLMAGAVVDTQTSDGKTALDLARANNKIETVKLLEESTKMSDLVSRAENGELTPYDKSNIDECEAAPWSALQYASLQELQGAVQGILEAKANVDKPNKNGDTALHFALRRGHFATAIMLVAAGGDITARNKEGQGLLDFIRRDEGLLDVFEKHQAAALLVLAASEGDTDLCRRLVEGKAELNATDQEHLTALMHAAKKDNIALAKILVEGKADLNVTDQEKWTAVHMASQNGQLDLMRLLIAAGANLNQANKDGETPAYSASFYGRVECLEELIKARADITCGTKMGWTPAHAATWNKQAKCMELLQASGAKLDDTAQRWPHALKRLFDAVKLGRAEDVLRLADEGTPVNTPDEDFLSPLHWAGRTGHAGVATALLTVGANVLAKDKEERTALNWAGRKGHVAVAVQLLKAGPIRTPDQSGMNEAAEELFRSYVEARDKAGKSALSWARQEGHKEMVQLLEKAPQLPSALLGAAEKGDMKSLARVLEQGTPLEARNQDGATALIMAGMNGHTPVAEALLQARAEVNAKEKNGKTALDCAKENGHIAIVELLSKATYQPKTPVPELRELLEQGQTMETKSEARLVSGQELPKAAEDGNVDRVRELLAQDVDLEARDSSGRTALMNAAWKDHVAVAEALVQAKAALDIKDTNGCTALRLAGHHGKHKVAAVLLKAKADMSLKDNNGQTALFVARENNRTAIVALLENYEQNGQALSEAVKKGQEEEVRRLLDDGVQWDLPDQDGATPLLHTVRRGHLDLFLPLVHAKAKIEHKDKSGVSAVDLLMWPPYWQAQTARVLALWAATGAPPPRMSRFATPMHYLATLQENDLKIAGSKVAQQGQDQKKIGQDVPKEGKGAGGRVAEGEDRNLATQDTKGRQDAAKPTKQIEAAKQDKGAASRAAKPTGPPEAKQDKGRQDAAKQTGQTEGAKQDNGAGGRAAKPTGQTEGKLVKQDKGAGVRAAKPTGQPEDRKLAQLDKPAVGRVGKQASLSSVFSLKGRLPSRVPKKEFLSSEAAQNVELSAFGVGVRVRPRQELRLSAEKYAQLPVVLCHAMLPWIESGQVRDERGLTALEALRQSQLPALRDWALSLGAFLGRYLVSQPAPYYESATSRVLMAEDVQAAEKAASRVALKLITGAGSEDNFQREKASRILLGGGQEAEKKKGKKQQGGSGRDWLVDVLRWHDRHLCLAMPAVDYSMNDYLRRHNVAGKAIKEVRSIAARVAQCLQQVHGRGLVHGDLKPNNIVSFRGQWALIDFSGASKFGDRVGYKYSSAYCPPELACVVARFGGPTTPEAISQLPVAEASFDVFSFGVLLYELCTGEQLFPHVADNIADEQDLQRLSVWLAVADDKLAQVFRHANSDQRNSGKQVEEEKSQSSDSSNSSGSGYGISETSTSLDRARQDARHLIRWCLQMDPKERPSLQQVLRHRFLDPDGEHPPTSEELEWKEFPGVLRCGSLRMRRHFFVSHMQAEAAGDVGTLVLELERHGAGVWRAVSRADYTEKDVRQGVADSDAFILFLTNGVLSCLKFLKEISWALEFDKPILVVLETDGRFFSFDWVRWTRDELHKMPGWDIWEVALNLGKAYKDLKEDPKFTPVHDKLQQLWMAHTMIPYRRREFEVKAMVREIFRQAGAAGCLWGARLPPRAPVQPPLLRVFLIYGARGAALAAELQQGLEAAYPSLQLQQSGRTDAALPAALQQAERVVVLLTGGLLEEKSALRHLRFAVLSGKPLYALYSQEDVWEFGGKEFRRAVQWCGQEVVESLEAMVFRRKRPREYEFVAMCDELVARMMGAVHWRTALSTAEVARKDQEHQAWLKEEEKREQEQISTLGRQAQRAAAEARADLERQLERERLVREAERRQYEEELAKVKAELEAERKEREAGLALLAQWQAELEPKAATAESKGKEQQAQWQVELERKAKATQVLKVEDYLAQWKADLEKLRTATPAAAAAGSSRASTSSSSSDNVLANHTRTKNA